MQTMRIFAYALFSIIAGLTAQTWSAEPSFPGVRAVALKIPPAGKTGFTLLPPDRTGVTFTNSLDEWASAGNRVLNNGSGVAAGDFDNDGLVDLFFCSLNQRNRLFKNLGNWQFEDVTAATGLRFPALYYHSAVFADVNSDGWLDLLIGSVARGVFCFLNDQRGHFTDATVEAGTATPFANQTLALADIDGNGTLDLYACNNRNDDIRDWARVPVMFVNKKPTVPPQLQERLTFQTGTLQEFGEPDLLYLNDGRAHFAYASWTNGAFFDDRGNVLTNTPLDWGLAAGFRDLNNDGAPDLYVCNDYWTPDRVWINGGRGRFKEIGSLAVRKIPASSMGVDFADINRDGHVDIFAVDMLSRSPELRRRQMVAKSPVPPRIGSLESRIQAPRNTLFLNRGDGTFAEIACFAGVEASDWSWSPMFMDVDLDGYDDLLITAGHLRDIQDLDANDAIRAQQESWRRTPMAATNLQRAFVEAKREHAKLYPPLNMPVVAFRNRGDLRFDEVTADWGLNVPAVHHGAALADLDNDGDLDLVVNRLGSPAAIFRNETTAPRIAVRLRGKAPNTQAIGGKIELFGSLISNQVHEVTSGGHYMSGSDTMRVFAPGNIQEGLRLQVRWRNGSLTEVPNVKRNHSYEIDELTVSRVMSNAPRPPNAAPMFEDVSALLNHSHYDEAFDDFARQPLLPRKLSQSGPGVGWFDVNGDGWEDLIIGAGKGGEMAVFRNRNGKAFVRETNSLFATRVTRDQTTVLGWQPAPGKRAILAGTSSYEDGLTNLPCVNVYDLATGRMESGLSGLTSSAGPLALADMDGDGDLDLFTGGNVIPGKYPLASGLLLFRNDAGQWSLDAENVRALTNAGMINGAVWSDLDADGLPELVLACEWGPVRIFRNRTGKLTEVTSEWGLAQFTGLWQSVTTGDFDGDGRLDIVAGNWGLNSCWRATTHQPLTILFGNLAGLGAVDILETEFDSQRYQLVPRHLRDDMAPAIPWLTARFPNHAAWSRATVADVIADRRDKMRSLGATTLATTVLLNRGTHFEAHPLPAEAQFAPSFGVCVADFDADGREDVFLAQNFFAFRVEEARLDASRGLLLRGDGQGGFKPVSGASGINMYGEQRAAAVADFDHDGRVDLVVTENSSQTKLFRNISAPPGLRVRVAGSTSNPGGIGAVLRAKLGEKWGPSREIHAGSGYWSQDSSVTVFGRSISPSAIQVVWPGGRRTEHSVSENQTEIILKP